MSIQNLLKVQGSMEAINEFYLALRTSSIGSDFQLIQDHRSVRITYISPWPEQQLLIPLTEQPPELRVEYLWADLDSGQRSGSCSCADGEEVGFYLPAEGSQAAQELAVQVALAVPTQRQGVAFG